MSALLRAKIPADLSKLPTLSKPVAKIACFTFRFVLLRGKPS